MSLQVPKVNDETEASADFEWVDGGSVDPDKHFPIPEEFAGAAAKDAGIDFGAYEAPMFYDFSAAQNSEGDEDESKAFFRGRLEEPIIGELKSGFFPILFLLP